MKIHFFILVLLAVAGLHAQSAQVILSTDGPETDPPMRVVWPTDPGIRYELQESFTLKLDEQASDVVHHPHS